ncbi:MAG: hypothetical protein K2N34_15495 [Lachnospiraceae bacterium]|nr:hypothetical protein [Lachnospiraceae bacterium]
MNKTIHTLKEKELEQKRIYDMMQNKTSKQALEIFKRPAFYGVMAVQENKYLKN